MVMRRHHDGSRSYAINDFPLVTDQSIEEYWIRKVERHRRVRQEIFAKYDAEAEEEEQQMLKRSGLASAASSGMDGVDAGHQGSSSFKAEL